MPVARRDADAAGIDVEPVSRPARPLQVRVTACEQRRVVAQERLERVAADLGQKHVVVGAGRAMERRSETTPSRSRRTTGAERTADLLDLRCEGPAAAAASSRATSSCRSVIGSGESSGSSSRKASALPSTVSQPRAASRSSVCAGCVPPCTTSPRQTISSTPRRSTSSSAARKATSFACWSEMSARRTARGYPALRVVAVLRKIVVAAVPVALVAAAVASAATGSARQSSQGSVSTSLLDARGDVHARGRLHLARARSCSTS